MRINEMRNYTAYEVVSVPDLNEGDVVLQHGGLFRLERRRDWDDGETATFDGVFIDHAHSDVECSIPWHWRPAVIDAAAVDEGVERYWQVQGNGLAKICRVTDSRPQYWHGFHAGETVWSHHPVPAAAARQLQAEEDQRRAALGLS